MRLIILVIRLHHNQHELVDFRAGVIRSISLYYGFRRCLHDKAWYLRDLKTRMNVEYAAKNVQAGTGCTKKECL